VIESAIDCESLANVAEGECQRTREQQRKRKKAYRLHGRCAESPNDPKLSDDGRLARRLRKLPA